MFRTLMFHINQSFDIERAVETAYLQWNSDIPKKDFTGVKLEELSKFEEVFAINVNIYSLSMKTTKQPPSISQLVYMRTHCI